VQDLQNSVIDLVYIASGGNKRGVYSVRQQEYKCEHCPCSHVTL